METKYILTAKQIAGLHEGVEPHLANMNDTGLNEFLRTVAILSQPSRENVKNSEAYFETEEIETFIGFGDGGSSFDKEGNMVGERRKLIILHQNGDNKEQLLEQLKTLVHGIENDFDGFAG